MCRVIRGNHTISNFPPRKIEKFQGLLERNICEKFQIFGGKFEFSWPPRIFEKSRMTMMKNYIYFHKIGGNKQPSRLF
jgi:hypothetical protein